MNQDAHNVIHDCLIEADYSPTDEAIAVVYKLLPGDIKHEASYWGWSDTCVRESVYEFIQNKGGSFLE